MRSCTIHAVLLKYGKAEVRRGYPPAPPDGYFEAVERLFPFSRIFEPGGCSVDPDEKNERRVLYCPECRRSERDWFQGRQADEFWQV